MSRVQAKDIRIVLVEPSHPGNIGGAARAMKTMGLEDLAIVNPLRFPDPQAVWRAAGAVDVVDNARVYGGVEDAIADCGWVVGTSARSRRVPWPVATVGEFAERLVREDLGGKPVAILFGREDRGLTNDELECCNLHVMIPANPEYLSLNLAMAVQVVCYEVLQTLTQAADTNVGTTDTSRLVDRDAGDAGDSGAAGKSRTADRLGPLARHRGRHGRVVSPLGHGPFDDRVPGSQEPTSHDDPPAPDVRPHPPRPDRSGHIARRPHPDRTNPRPNHQP